jgi:hypothetical protein
MKEKILIYQQRILIKQFKTLNQNDIKIKKCKFKEYKILFQVLAKVFYLEVIFNKLELLLKHFKNRHGHYSGKY